MRPISIGTNMMECGPAWRMGKEHLAPLAECGATHVEVHMGARHEPAPGDAAFRLTKCFIDFSSDRHPEQIRRWLDDFGMAAVSLHTSPMGAVDLASDNEAVRAYAARDLGLMPRVAETVGAPVMVVHPGGIRQEGVSLGSSWPGAWPRCCRPRIGVASRSH